MKTEKIKNKLLGLEAIRFISAFSILIWHYQHFLFFEDKAVNFSPNLQPFYSYLEFFYHWGLYGVNIFWCVSGFIFFWKYKNLILEKKISGKNFFLLRFSRLYPLHFVTLLIVAVLQTIYFKTNGVFFVYQFNDLYHFILQIFFISDGQNGGTNEIDGVFKDTAAWFHLVWSCDADNGTNALRWRVYINGVERAITGDPTIQDANGIVNRGSSQEHWIGGRARGVNSNTDDSPFSGYIAEVVFIDDATLAPTSFGEFDEDSGIWKPLKSVEDLTFGAKGYYLNFQDSAELGTDVSGNDYDFAETGLTAIDQSTDTCTNNFAVMNPLDNFYAGGTFAQGNLQVTTRNTGYSYNTATFGVSTGKWYWEVKWSAQNTGSTNQVVIGIAKRTVVSATVWLGSVAWTYGYQGSTGHVHVSDGNATNSTSTTYSVGDIISVALDLDNNKIHFAKNGTYTNSSDAAGNSGGVTITAPDSVIGDSGFYFPAFGDGNDSLQETGQFNFGSPIHAISSGNADANGHGNFEYAVPSGYFALCTKNLAGNS